MSLCFSLSVIIIKSQYLVKSHYSTSLPVSFSFPPPSWARVAPVATEDMELAGRYPTSVPSAANPLWRNLAGSGGSGLTEEGVDKCFGCRCFCSSMALPTEEKARVNNLCFKKA